MSHFLIFFFSCAIWIQSNNESNLDRSRYAIRAYSIEQPNESVYQIYWSSSRSSTAMGYATSCSFWTELSKRAQEEAIRKLRPSPTVARQLGKEFPYNKMPDGVDDTRKGQEKAARLYYERLNDKDIPEYFRLQAAWGIFSYFGPNYFFSDTFIGQKIGFNKQQIKDIRSRSVEIAESIESDFIEARKFVLENAFDTLSVGKTNELFSIADRASFIELTNYPIAEPYWQLGKGIESRASTLIPMQLLTEDFARPLILSSKQIELIRSHPLRNVDDMFRTMELLGAPECPPEFREVLSTTTTPAKTFDPDSYYRWYETTLGLYEPSHKQMLFLMEFRRRGVSGLLGDRNVQAWLSLDRSERDRIQSELDKLLFNYQDLLAEMINARCSGLFGELSKEQNDAFFSVIGLKPTEFERVFQNCTAAELKTILGKKSPPVTRPQLKQPTKRDLNTFQDPAYDGPKYLRNQSNDGRF